MGMTSRDRILATVEARKVDRPPFVIEWGPWEQTLRRWLGEGMSSEGAWRSLFGFDPFHVDAGVQFGIYPPFQEEVLSNEGEAVIIRDGNGVLQRILKETTSMPQYLRYPVRDRRSWEQLKWRFDPDTPGRFPPDWAARARELQSAEALVTVDSYPYGFLGGARTLMGAENALVAFTLDPELIDDINETLLVLWLTLLDRIAAETRLDEIAMWEDMAGKQGSLISPQMFRRFLTPGYRSICGFARKRGVGIVSVDSDGYVHELTELFLQAGVKVIYPFEVQAGNNLPALLRRHRSLCAMGGMDKRALAGDQSSMDAEIERIEAILELGRYIPFPDHGIPVDVSWKNFQYFVWRWKELTGKKD
jgi:hypothetical protein